MKQSATGQFYGVTNQTLNVDGLTITDTVYTHEKVDWHYHEQPHFTFILNGKLLEGNKKETIHCQPGTLLFHNWQDPHYNSKPPGQTRGLQLELSQAWLREYTDSNIFSGSRNLKDPRQKQLMYQLFKEVKLYGPEGKLAISALLLELLQTAAGCPGVRIRQRPQWVNRLKELLREENTAQWSLTDLARPLAIHPVHLSAEFPKYFNCSLGAYIRSLKMEYALRLLPRKEIALTRIAFECGFADQSHFNRNFKAVYGLTPLQYQRLI